MDSLWILNLDAEYEMARPADYRRSVRLERAAENGLRLARRLLSDGDSEVSLSELASGVHAGRHAKAWCVTPSVIQACERGGVHLEQACSFEIVRAANDRQFCASLGQNLDDACFFTPETGALERILATLASSDRNWLAKRSFGVAGRGQRRIQGSSIETADVDWLRASLRLGGVQVEPFLPLTAEFSVHCFLHEEREPSFGEACLEERDARGNFIGARTLQAGELLPRERTALTSELERVAEALQKIGYRGPFGIDAFRWENARGDSEFRALSEVNARFTLAWAPGMACMRASGDDLGRTPK